jgi:hypothetical protein
LSGLSGAISASYREPPAAVTEGEIVVASNEELHAARLSGKRLLALWNSLPDIGKRKKVGDRDALVNELWSAIETGFDLLEEVSVRPLLRGKARSSHRGVFDIVLPPRPASGASRIGLPLNRPEH